MYDKELLLRDGSSNMTNTETGTGVDMGPDRTPLTYTLTVPLSPAKEMSAKVQASYDNTNWFDLTSFHPTSGSAFVSGSAAGEWHATAKSNARYRRFYANVVSGPASGSGFGKVFCGPQLGGLYNRY